MSTETLHYDEAAPETPREPWNYELFVRFHDAKSNQIGGWPYITDEGTPYLQSDYENSEFKTIQAFAEFIFRYEQVTADDVHPKFKTYKAPQN